MEKDIKILEWLIELWKHNGEMERETQAIESLIKGYRELEEENKILKENRDDK